jgi:quinoprotein glucose dehydrogenase
VFIAAAFDGKFRTYEVTTGDELCSDALPTSGNAVPMRYVSGARQYVVIAAGGHWAAPTDASDQLIAYALPRK